MLEILKIGYTQDNVIKKIYVFAGTMQEISNKDNNELIDFFKTSEGDIFLKKIFTESELVKIEEDKTEIIVINSQIHIDDTIETIKRKIILNCSEFSAFDEMYLFAYQLTNLEPISVYQNLTQNGKLELTRMRLVQFIQNVQGISLKDIPDKEIYDYEDIFALELDKEPRLIAKPLGQKFVAIDSTYPYTVNPYDVTNVEGYDDFLVKFADNITTTTNKSILMNFGSIHNNLINVCVASDVLANAEVRGLSQESCIRIYYPFIAEKGIRELSELIETLPSLINDTAKMIGPGFIENSKNVTMFYDISRKESDELNISEAGIKSIKVTVHPDVGYNLPLDVVFKLIHASKSVPLIKYNPGKRQEKIYRLHTNRIASNGKKIPSLSRSEIMKLVKSLGKNKSVSVYIAHKESDSEMEMPIICEFESNGNYSISATFEKSMKPDEIDDIFKKATEPILTTIKEYLSQSGYIMMIYDGLYSKMTEINNLEYSLLAPIKRKINLNRISGCLSSIFSIVRSNINEGAIMRYKRVSNFNEMDSSEAYIIEMINAGSRDNEIIQGLMMNFQLDMREARERLASFVSRLQLVQDAFQGTGRLKVKNNPGFLTTMTLEEQGTALRVIVNGVNNIDYLKTISVYVNALIKITQYPTTYTNKQCKKEVNVSDRDVAEKEDIIAPAEQPEAQEKKMNIVAEEITFEEKDEEELDNMMDILMMSDDEDEDDDDDDDDEDDDNDVLGMGINSDKDDELVERDITGMNLANPNPFFKRLKERDPTLFLVDNEGKFKSYSRICPWNVRRQPVILTDSEKNRIDAEHPGSYTNAIKYGTSTDKQYWYICPKYWSIRDGVSLTEEQAKSGDYGEIIPRDAKKVPPGGNIFQFYSDDDANQHKYPGFQKRDSHPQGKCIPCCFKTWDSPSQKKRREDCERDEQGEIGDNEIVGPEPLAPAIIPIIDEYVVGPDKFPLTQGRYGYLPLILQKFFNNDNRKCQVSQTNTSLKEDYPCILRYGVESSKEQSFVGAIAAIWADENKGEVVSISDMKNIIINAIDLDLFTTVQNGNLIEIFDPEVNVNISEPWCTNSKIYKNTNMNNPNQLNVLKKIARSYLNFLDYLRDDNVKIDYTYLWDIVCNPNPNLFKYGMNLAIISLNQDDMTDNLEIICPSNHYASTFFDSNRRTAIILKIGNYFEPIFQFEKGKKKDTVARRFSTKSDQIIPNLRKTLELIKMSMNEKCNPLPSMPKVYKFTQNIALERLVHLLRLKNYKILQQILNYNGKVVSLLVEKKVNIEELQSTQVKVKSAIKGIIPCYPSSPMMDLDVDFKWFDEPIGQNYEETLLFLNSVYNDSKGKIPCKPVIKILEDNLIVGILTQTNQFVPISPPIQDIYGDDLIKLEDSNYAVIDKISITEDKVDNKRIELNKRIRMETGFFNAFRNTIRILLGQFKNIRIREEIESLSLNKDIAYLSKLRRIDKLLRELSFDSIEFTDYQSDVLSEIEDVTSCYNSEQNCDIKQFCVTRDDGSCALIIPKINLINEQDNEKVYYGRLADEIVRYSRIQKFIFQPKAFLTFSNLKYNLRKDELILLQSLLVNKPDYFEDIVPEPINNFIKYNTYDTSEPINSQIYSNVIEISKTESKLDSKIIEDSFKLDSLTEGFL